MFYFFSLISFIIIAHPFLISILNASSSVDDKMLIAFMKGHQETQISEYSMEKYEAHLGIIYFMRKNWKCDRIEEEFEEYERTECQKYRKYLDILYEYLYREYVGIPTEKPKFVFKRKHFKNEIEIDGPIIYAVNCLVKISQFYFICTEQSKYYEYKLNKLFTFIFEPKLLNEERLKYEVKLTFNEMILHLAIDTANEWQSNEIVDGIIQQNCRQKFKENLEEMLKKATENAKDDNPGRANLINDDKHWIILYSKFDDQNTWTKDAIFTEYVKGLAKNFEKFFKMAKEYSNYLSQIKEKSYGNYYRLVSYRLYETEKMKKHLIRKYEAHLGLVYLMRENWHCSYIIKFSYEWRQCQKYRKYLEILYEYLFRLYVQGKSNELVKKFQAVKPKFMWNIYHKELINVVKTLYEFSKTFYSIDMVLINEIELNYEIKKEANLFSKFKQNILEKINAPKNEQKKGKNILNLPNELEDNLRQEFEQKMEKMCQNTKENAKEEKAKLEKAIENAANYEEKHNLKEEYDEKFYFLNSLPFS